MTTKKTTTKANVKSSASRNASNYGKYVFKKTKSEILECPCGDKYLKTREGQETCIRCLYHTAK
ncbi:MAG: hypothetical protein WDZ88_03740 [Candidatus Paceibacterota bacterium]